MNYNYNQNRHLKHSSLMGNVSNSEDDSHYESPDDFFKSGGCNRCKCSLKEVNSYIVDFGGSILTEHGGTEDALCQTLCESCFKEVDGKFERRTPDGHIVHDDSGRIVVDDTGLHKITGRSSPF